MLIASLEKLGGKKSRGTPLAREKAMFKLERAVGPLPENYKELLLYFGGDIEFSALVVYKPTIRSPWTNEDGKDMLDSFYGLSSQYKSTSILDIYKMYSGRIPLPWLPIASAPGGNQLCLALTGDSQGAVKFWDHECEVAPDFHQAGSGLSDVAQSLEEFVSLLKLDESPTPDLADVKVNLRF